MSIITFSLIFHVAIGLVGVIASYAFLMGLLKKSGSLSFLFYSSLTAFLSYMLSWFSGGYYYVVKYGGSVKPIIKEGDYPWAHFIFTETKEHVFLFLPILSLVAFIAVVVMRDSLWEEKRFKNLLIFVTIITVLIGVFITLSGVLMSGAVR